MAVCVRVEQQIPTAKQPPMLFLSFFKTLVDREVCALGLTAKMSITNQSDHR